MRSRASYPKPDLTVSWALAPPPPLRSPSSCSLRPFSAEGFCRALAGRGVMFIGDSISASHASSLYNLLRGPSDYVSDGARVAPDTPPPWWCMSGVNGGSQRHGMGNCEEDPRRMSCDRPSRHRLEVEC